MLIETGWAWGLLVWIIGCAAVVAATIDWDGLDEENHE
jgi:hypothetical protein